MTLIAPAYETVNPSMMLPEIIMPYTQASGAFALLPEEQPRVMLGEGDLAVYIRRLDVRTKSAVGQSAYNMMPSPDIVASMISTPTYLVRNRAEYDHHDSARAGAYGFSLTEATRLANQQAIVNTARALLLYGANPANGEGLINTNGATATSLPPDSFGNTTISTYDNGQLAFFFSTVVGSIKVKTNNMGIGRKFVFLSSQRVLQTIGYNVVQLVQYQRPGAGSDSSAGLIASILMSNGDTVIWGCDDTLIGKGAGGSEAIICAMPQVAKPAQANPWNTNRFADLSPGMEATLSQLVDLAAPREITVPLPGGAVDTVYEERMTSGWAFRPEALTIISATF
jgi:hypothetical protein